MKVQLYCIIKRAFFVNDINQTCADVIIVAPPPVSDVYFHSLELRAFLTATLDQHGEHSGEQVSQSSGFPHQEALRSRVHHSVLLSQEGKWSSL